MVNKIKGLVVQSRVDVKKLLVIGGVSLNTAFIKLLKEDLPNVKVVLKDVSPVFEAYGAALLAKDNPVHEKLNLTTSKSFSILPALEQFMMKRSIL
jgi:activator of 2-hydroxyglutaryl-CoA dehydratase